MLFRSRPVLQGCSQPYRRDPEGSSIALQGGFFPSPDGKLDFSAGKASPSPTLQQSEKHFSIKKPPPNGLLRKCILFSLPWETQGLCLRCTGWIWLPCEWEVRATKLLCALSTRRAEFSSSVSSYPRHRISAALIPC